jgi:hypothetical protein
MKKLILVTNFIALFFVISASAQSNRKIINDYNDIVKVYQTKNYENASLLLEDFLQKYEGKMPNDVEYYALHLCYESFENVNNYQKALIYVNKTLNFLESGKIKLQDQNKFLSLYKEKREKFENILNPKQKEVEVVTKNEVSTKTDVQVKEVAPKSDDKTVTLTVSGTGKTLEEAKTNATRSAIEQAFGAFISSKTEILNDNLIRDEIVSVTNGNIKSFEILNQDQLPDGRWGVTLKAIVSVDKLSSFVESKGIAIEIKGGLFALNIKQQLLNEQGEIKAVAEMVGLLHEPMQISFDYVIKSSEPKSLDAESENWEIPLEVTATVNKNLDFCANYFKKTLAAISLTPSEVELYQSLNKKVFKVMVKHKNQSTTYYLRKEASIDAIISFYSNWSFYSKLFTVQSGMNESFGHGISKYKFKIQQISYDSWKNDVVVDFLNLDEVAANYYWNDKLTLSQIEQMNGYKIKPTGVVSEFKYGGYVVYEKNGHGLVMSLFDIKARSIEDAKNACMKLDINGYNDWRIPTPNELSLIDKKMYLIGLGGLSHDGYHTLEDNKTHNINLIDMTPIFFPLTDEDGRERRIPDRNGFGYGKRFVRAVRAF